MIQTRIVHRLSAGPGPGCCGYQDDKIRSLPDKADRTARPGLAPSQEGLGDEVWPLVEKMPNFVSLGAAQ